VFTSPNHYFSNTRLFRELYADIEFTINVFKKPVMSSCLNQCGASQDGLDLLELIVEELLRRAGLYALSISTGVECSLDDTWKNAYAIRNVTALKLFNAIPGQLLRGHHLQRICDSSEFGCEGWKEIMRRALCVSREYGNVSLSRAWNGTCLLKP
jgi:hypothetical protein